jgi:hypothetical protein
LQRVIKQKAPTESNASSKMPPKCGQLNINKLSLVERALAYMMNMPQEVHKVLQQAIEIEFECATEQHFILLDALNIIRQNGGLSTALLVQILVEKYESYKTYFHQLLQVQIELEAVQLIDELMAMLDKIMKQACQNELEHLIAKAKTSILTASEKQRMQTILHKVDKV